MSDFMPEPDAYDWRNDPNLKEKWKKRFAFFDSVPPVRMFKGSPEMAARLKAMPLKERLLVLNNWLAFFFTFIYVGFFLKLWKQALMIFGLAMLAGVIGAILDLSDNVVRALGFGISYLFSLRANYWYYLSKAKGKNIGWML